MRAGVVLFGIAAIPAPRSDCVEVPRSTRGRAALGLEADEHLRGRHAAPLGDGRDDGALQERHARAAAVAEDAVARQQNALLRAVGAQRRRRVVGVQFDLVHGRPHGAHVEQRLELRLVKVRHADVRREAAVDATLERAPRLRVGHLNGAKISGIHVLRRGDARRRTSAPRPRASGTGR